MAIKYIICDVQLTRLHEYASFGGGSSLNIEFGPDVIEGGSEPDPVPILKIDLVIELGSDIIESGSLSDDTGGSQNTDMDISVEFGTDVTE